MDVMKRPINYKSLIKKMKNPLHLAVANEQLEIVSSLLTQKVDVNAKEISGITPIHVAVKKENLNILKLLLKAGADVNSSDHKYTPLHLSVYSNNVNVMSLLLEAGADVSVSAKDDDRSTPVHLATLWENVNILRLLLENGVDVNSKNDYGDTALHYSAWSGTIDILNLLLEAGADVNAQNYRGRTPLSSAGETRVLSILKLLIKAGADVNKKSHLEETPFIHMVKAGSMSRFNLIESMRLLIEYVNIDLTDKDGKNILSETLKSLFVKSDSIYEFVIEHIAKLNALNIQSDSRILDDIFIYKSEFKNYFTMCTQELERAKKTKLHNCWVSFFNLLTDDKSKFVKYAGNKYLVEDFEKNVDEFPIYGNTMKANMTKGIDGRKFFDGAANILSYHLPVFDVTHLIIRDVLNTLCKQDWKKLCK